MSHTVLIVDDDPRFLTFAGRTLSRAGFAVLSVSDGTEVPEVLSGEHVDALVLDLHMDGMNGWEVIRWLREGSRLTAGPHRGERPKVLVVSGRDEETTIRFVRTLGADAYVTKPLLGKELVSAVRGVLAK